MPPGVTTEEDAVGDILEEGEGLDDAGETLSEVEEAIVIEVGDVFSAFCGGCSHCCCYSRSCLTTNTCPGH